MIQSTTAVVLMQALFFRATQRLVYTTPLASVDVTGKEERGGAIGGGCMPRVARMVDWFPAVDLAQDRHG